MDWPDTYDGATEWSTYGWAKWEGSLAAEQEFFRLTINNDPVGDAEYLGDRSLTAFIHSADGQDFMYFSVYNYGYLPSSDSTNVYYKVDVTGYLSKWFYTYTAYSVSRQSAMAYLLMGDDDDVLEISHQITSF